jgi:hypothetical protein
MSAAAIPVARAAWPESPCAGREIVRLNADATLRAYDLLDGHDSFARAGIATCEVWVRHVTIPLIVPLCVTLVHEFGHLAGYAHPDEDGPHPLDPALADVMGTAETYPPCDALVRTPARDDHEGRAEQEIWSRMPQGRGPWRVRCHRGVCRAIPGIGRCQRHYLYDRDLAVTGPRMLCP